MLSRGQNSQSSGIPGVVCALLLLLAPHAEAKLEDVEKEIQKSQAAFVERFTQFTQDKNFMGKPRNPDGKIVAGIKKTTFNADDQGPFQSDLTYHDKAYEVEDEAFAKKVEAEIKAGKDPKGVKRRFIYAGISDHGAVAAAGGSSALERAAYQLYDQYAKEESKDEKKQEDEKNGISYRGVFKVETQDVKKDNKPKGANDQDDAPEKVERWSLRDEAKPKIEEVGKNSFQTLEKSAVNDKVDPQNAMPNLAYYYEAANKALLSLWNSTLGNLGQRRAYKAVDPKAAPENVQLSLGTANCGQWGQQQIAKIQDPDPQQRQQKIDDINRMVQQCTQVAQVSYRQINPRFEKPDDPGGGGGNSTGGGGGGGGGGETLVMKGPEEEDARERDWRVQLSVLEKVKTQAQEVPSNWKYNDQDNRAPVTTQYDQNGQAAQTETLKMIDSVDKYNKNLKDASEGLAEVKTRFPQLQTDTKAPLKYMKTGEESAMEITKFPEQAAYEGFESPVAKGKEKPAENYDQLTSGRTAQ